MREQPPVEHSLPERRRTFSSLLTGAAGLYGGGLSALLAARLVVRDAAFAPMAFAASFLHLMFLPSLALLPLALLRRRWRLAAVLLPPTARFFAIYGRSFLPRPAPAKAKDGDTFSFLTYNLHAELKAFDPMIAIIRAADADIVNVQELGFETARRFDAEFGAIYPDRALHPHPWPNAGQGVMSRFPVREDVYWQHSQIHEALGHQRVVIDVRGTPVTLYTTHPVHPGMAESGFSTGPRGQEIRDVLARAERENSAILIAGDFNMSDQSDDYRYIAARYGDSSREVGYGLGLSFPDWSQPTARTSNLSHALGFLPLLVRLDYIFHNDHLRPLEARVWPDAGGSDHRPVFVRLAVQ